MSTLPAVFEPATVPAWEQWAAQEAFCFALPPRTRFLVEGPDAFRYLQGQTSNDLSQAKSNHAIPTCLLTVKGRIVSVPFVWRSGEQSFVLEVPESFREITAQRLERYLVADEVEITEHRAPATWHVVGGSNPPADARFCARLHREGSDTEIPPSPSAQRTLLSSEEAEVLRVVLGVAGEPEWRLDVFPAEIGLDRTAVDFHKGCYLGQEVVSRLESVGQARRELVRWSGAQLLPSGTGLHLEGQSREVGHIASSLSWPFIMNPTDSPTPACGLAIMRSEILAAKSPPPPLFALPDSAHPVSIHLIP